MEAFWIWYPGDFEIYHGLLQNFSREERGFDWPAYWYMDDCRKNVKFIRTYHLETKESFTAYSRASGYLLVNGEKHCFGETVCCDAGTTEIEIFAGMVTGVPAIYVEGKQICSDKNWLVTDFISEPVKAGYSMRYVKKDQDPSVWEYETMRVLPAAVAERCGGTLYDFGRELTAEVLFTCEEQTIPFTMCYGESETEALDVENCYYSQTVTEMAEPVRKRAFRYIFIPECSPGVISLEAEHYYVDIPSIASFSCSDEEVNQIWRASEETFKLCSGIFFIDGIKRDRWIWSGDAYQSYLVNQYLMFDEEINKRTIWALRGNDPVRQHINTIVDYSMYWIISICNHYEMTGDTGFIKMIGPKMDGMMEFLEQQLDEHGFIVGRHGDWIFIDWAEIDKEGPVCAEQMLLAMCYHTMQRMEKITGRTSHCWGDKFDELRKNIDLFFWSEEKQAYIDSFSSGKGHVTRHANLFAILFEFVEKERAEQIYRSVLCNDAIPSITTPYFKFFELEAFCKLGRCGEVLKQMKAYWGGILKEGATTIWEEYDPKQQGAEHYRMYGDPYGKSLCHAWGASPIYMIGKYFMGVEATDTAYGTFRVSPKTDLFSSFQGTVPVKGGLVHIAWDGSCLKVKTDRAGGTLFAGGKRIELEKDREYAVHSL